MNHQKKQLTITYLPIDLLSHRSNNARSITTEKFKDLKRSLEVWEFAEPITVSLRSGVYNIVSGHQRVMAAKELGHKSVPCIVLEDLNQQQETALGIRLNRSSGQDVVDELAEALSSLDVELQQLAGFDEDALLALQPDPFDDEEPEEKASVKKYSVEKIRDLAKSYYPEQADTILEFCDWLDKK